MKRPAKRNYLPKSEDQEYGLLMNITDLNEEELNIEMIQVKILYETDYFVYCEEVKDKEFFSQRGDLGSVGFYDKPCHVRRLNKETLIINRRNEDE